MEMDDVAVNDCVSSDLSQGEEAVFEVVSLNPGENLESIRSRYDLGSDRIVEITDSLQDKGLIRAVDDDEFNDCVWMVTELGRLRLLRFYQVMRFEVMEAKLLGQPQGQVELLEEKKKGFKVAARQCKALFGGGSGE